MARVAFMEINGDPFGNQGTAYVFEQDTGRLMQEFSFTLEDEITIELPEGVEETVVSVPLDMLGIRAIDIPMDDPDRIRDVLPFELEGLVLGDPSQMVFDAVLLGSGPLEEGQKQRVLAAYIEKEKLGSLLGSLKKAGIDPRAVTSSELGELVKGIREGKELFGLMEEAASRSAEQRLDRARLEAESPTVDFRRGEFAYTKETEKTLRMGIRTAALAVALVLVLSGHMALKAMNLGKEAAAIEQSTLQVYASLFPGEKPESTKGLRYRAEAKVKALRGKAALFREASTLQLFMSLKDTAREGLRLTEITVDSNAVILRGTATSPEIIHALKDDLGGFLEEVTISESGAAASGGTGFSISAKKGAR